MITVCGMSLWWLTLKITVIFSLKHIMSKQNFVSSSPGVPNVAIYLAFCNYFKCYKCITERLQCEKNIMKYLNKLRLLQYHSCQVPIHYGKDVVYVHTYCIDSNTRGATGCHSLWMKLPNSCLAIQDSKVLLWHYLENLRKIQLNANFLWRGGATTNQQDNHHFILTTSVNRSTAVSS